MEHRLREQIAANAAYLNDYMIVLEGVRQSLQQTPQNRLLQVRVAMLEASIQIMAENIDMLKDQLKAFTPQ